MPELKIATYNIHGCIGTDKKLSVERTAEVIREIDADVTGLQEAGNLNSIEDGKRQFDKLRQLLPMNCAEGAVLANDRGYYGNAIFTKQKFQSVSYLDLKINNHEPRALLDVVLNPSLRIFLTHLGLNRFERKEQIAKIQSYVTESGAPGNHRKILLGDMNDWIPFRNSFSELIDSTGWQGLNNQQRSFPSKFPVFKLDRIYYDSDFKLKSIYTHKSQLSRVASDHLPVVAVLSF